VTTAAALSMLYILMQTFAVPGTISLSLLAGALFGPYYGLALVAVVSAPCWCRPLLRALPRAPLWRGPPGRPRQARRRSSSPA
jgi:uncharacterized membrane protein YdjX (TVP38/TMEM64 family)